MSFSPGQYPGEQQPNEAWRLLVVVAVVTLLWMAWPILFPSPEPAQAPADAGPAASQIATPASAPAEDGGSVATAAATTPASQPGATSAPAPAPQDRPEEAFFERRTTLATARLSSWGATLVGYQLSTYKDIVKKKEGETAPPVDLVPGKGAGDRSFIMRAIDGTFPLAPDAAYQLLEESENELVFQHDTGRGVVVTRSYRFSPEAYAFDVTNRFENHTDAVQSVSLQMSVSGRERDNERESGGFFMPPVDQMGWACRTEELHQKLSRDHENDETLPGAVRWAGINRQYFLAALVPRQGQTTSCAARRTTDKGMQVAVEFAPLTIPAGQSVDLVVSGYFGPKQMGRLKRLEAGVDEAIDFGWFGIIARPLLWLLVFFYGYVGNYGIAILLLTFLVKLVLLPVTQKSFESAERMKKIQPLLKEIQAKYKSDRMMASQKQMELFKEHKVSPFGGCLPMLLQMPIWIALYRTLWSSVELYQQPFIEGWIDNLAFKDPTYVLPISVGVVMMVQQFFTPMPQDNPSMKYVMWGMPIMFTFIMISLPSGLALYILANSVLTIFQQMYIRRKFAAASPAPSSTPDPAPVKNKNKKKK